MQENFSKILEYLGEDIHRSGLEKTPENAARTFNFLTQGYNQSLEDIAKQAVENHSSEMLVIEQNIQLYSLCEETLLPIIGKCHIAYAPHGKKIRSEKIQEIVNLYARRLQNQDNLTQQIAKAISKIAHTPSVAVIISAKHLSRLMVGGKNSDHAEQISSCFMGELQGNQEVQGLLLG